MCSFMPKDHWHLRLDGLKITRRKWYCTRHTFISPAVSNGAPCSSSPGIANHTFVSAALSRGFNLKLLAEYCGTSVAMIEQSYGRFLATRVAAQLALLDDTSTEGSGVALGQSTTSENRDLCATVSVSA